MKPMTFEEWDSLPKGHFSTRPQMMAFLFDKARIGMIPEDGTIRIPDWPRDAKELLWQWNYGTTCGPLNIIPRPRSSWVPRVGDEVFAIWKDSISPNIFVGIVKTVNTDNTVVTIGGSDRGFGSCNLKPFNPAYIGKPWSEIPEGKDGN